MRDSATTSRKKQDDRLTRTKTRQDKEARTTTRTWTRNVDENVNENKDEAWLALERDLDYRTQFGERGAFLVLDA